MSIQMKYSKEINEIHNEILRLEKGKIYELEHINGYPSYTTIASNLREKLDSLLEKIDNNSDSVLDKLRETERKMDNN